MMDTIPGNTSKSTERTSDDQGFTVPIQGKPVPSMQVNCRGSSQNLRYFHQVFHFHHIDSKKKDPHYENVIRRAISTEVLDEVDKCVLVCSRCHAIIHGQGITGSVLLTLNVRGKKYE